MRPNVRLALAVWVSFAVIAATLTLNAHSTSTGTTPGADALKKAYTAAAANKVAARSGAKADRIVYNADGSHTHLPGTPTHDHNNPATKNSVTRVTAAEADGDT